MSVVKSFSVGNGDMFYIEHITDSFTIIDCCISEENKDRIISEIKSKASCKGIVRFISTHPDDDHIKGLVHLDDAIELLNFYCVKNDARKSDPIEDFKKYCTLRDDEKKAFHMIKGCSRKWLNKTDEVRGGAGIHVLWPIITNENYLSVLADVKKGKSPNNLSCVVEYILKGGAKLLWMGDLESDFMEKIKDDFTPDAADILFAPHHGRDSGKVPADWLNKINPKIVIIGEAPSEDLNYYEDYDTITQNLAGDITLQCVTGKTHIYVSSSNYSVDFLQNEDIPSTYGNYIGTLKV